MQSEEQKTIIKFAQSSWINISVCACVNKEIDLVYTNYKSGSYNTEEMNSDILELNNPLPTLVMDNCSIHSEDTISQWAQENVV